MLLLPIVMLCLGTAHTAKSDHTAKACATAVCDDAFWLPECLQCPDTLHKFSALNNLPADSSSADIAHLIDGLAALHDNRQTHIARAIKSSTDKYDRQLQRLLRDDPVAQQMTNGSLYRLKQSFRRSAQQKCLPRMQFRGAALKLMATNTNPPSFQAQAKQQMSDMRRLMQGIRERPGFDASKELTFRRIERQMDVLNRQLGTNRTADQLQQRDTLQMLRANVLAVVSEMRHAADATPKVGVQKRRGLFDLLDIDTMIRTHVTDSFCDDMELSGLYGSICQATQSVLNSGLGSLGLRRSGDQDDGDYYDNVEMEEQPKDVGADYA